MHREIAHRRRSSKEPFRWGGLVGNPWCVEGAFYGLSVGALTLAILPSVWPSPWALPCAGGLTLFLSILGLLIGRAADTRDSLRDLIR